MGLLTAVVVAAICVVTGVSGKDLVVRDCTNLTVTSPIITINNYSFVPYPIPSPGQLTASLSATLNRPIPAGGLELKVHIRKDVFFWITINCKNNFGSCDYDLCDLLSYFENTTCPQQLIDNNIPCTCGTIVPGTYNLINQVFEIPDVTTISSFALGDYQVQFSLVDKVTLEEVYCLHVELTVKDPNACSGFLCSLFGRRGIRALWSWLF
ncbi:unnamed protein product [Lymnaea stagnalis]|uniref:MD-2-related lipid-recognition domain-containing protein n=1 Tax=Lymnaea stagnalis TaxID=6523 RepID=A0AAV2HF42_LYMST